MGGLVNARAMFESDMRMVQGVMAEANLVQQICGTCRIAGYGNSHAVRKELETPGREKRATPDSEIRRMWGLNVENCLRRVRRVSSGEKKTCMYLRRSLPKKSGE